MPATDKKRGQVWKGHCDRDDADVASRVLRLILRK
jgi:hypothetical protein